MPSIFSINKKTASLLLFNLCLLFLSLPTILSKPNSNLRFASTLADSDDTDGCWIESYGRGVGKPVSTCPPGMEQNGALCYPLCQDGYVGDGPVCWQKCPDGFKNTGADCLKPSSYGRGSGYASNHEKKCDNENSQGCEKWGAMWYPKCQDNFHNVGCCVCSPNCPAGMLDIGVSCQKKSYGRGVGKPLVCTSSQDEDAGLCYTKCKAGWNGKGPVCWGTCPAGMYQCGALCVPSGEDCASDMLEIADKVMSGINEAGEEEDNEGAAITIGETGVDVGTKLAKYGMCKNM